MAGNLQLINPGGADGLAASKYFLFAEFQLSAAAVQAPQKGMPVGFSVAGDGTIMPFIAAAATGFISLPQSLLGAALDNFVLPPTAQNNTNPAIATFGPATSGPNTGLGNVIVGGYIIGAPVLGDATTAALTQIGVNFGSGALTAGTSGTVTSPSVVSGCWTPYTIAAGGAEVTQLWPNIDNANFAGKVGRTGNFNFTANSNILTTWSGTNLVASDVGAAVHVTGAGNAGGTVALDTYITSILSTTSCTVANPALATNTVQSSFVGTTVDLWMRTC